MYGRGPNAIAEQLGISKQEAQNIIDMFFKAFPKVKEFITLTHISAKQLGFVSTVWGTKRRLPEIQLPLYQFEDKETGEPVEAGVSDYYYLQLISSRSNKDKSRIKSQAWKQGVKVHDNGGKIADAERQSVNSIIQGTSAVITKRAMVAIGQNEELKELGFRLLLTVHDELIGESPVETAKRCGEIMVDLMLKAANLISVPMKCDVEFTEVWYGDEVEVA